MLVDTVNRMAEEGFRLHCGDCGCTADTDIMLMFEAINYFLRRDWLVNTQPPKIRCPECREWTLKNGQRLRGEYYDAS